MILAVVSILVHKIVISYLESCHIVTYMVVVYLLLSLSASYCLLECQKD